MQQDNNNMDKKLRQLENQSLPDLSKMEDHWQQMKDSLQPGIVPAKTGSRKNIFPWIIAACIAGGLFFAFKEWILQPKKIDTPIGQIKKETITKKETTADTIPDLKFVIGKDTIIFKPQKKKKPVAPQFFLKAKTADGKDTIFQATPVNDMVTTPPVPEKKTTLEEFFSELKKESQEFTINNSRDTLITGNSGTALLIPANTFNSKDPVTIIMKEYYTYQDIITNRLSTCSNGQQLITGGMLHLAAISNGKEVDIQTGKSIRWFVPDTTSQMSGMNLFTGLENRNQSLINVELISKGKDTLSLVEKYNEINWIPQDRFFSDSYLYTSVWVLDLRNNPFKLRNTGKGLVGKFHIASDSKISEEELKKSLGEKYNYYKIVIKKDKVKESFFRRLMPFFIKKIDHWKSWENLGDSAWVSPETAKLYNLRATDTIVSRRHGIGSSSYDVFDKNITRKKNISDSLFSGKNLNNLAKRFSVDIRTLGWINCDRFYNDNRPRIEYYVDLKDTAANYYTLLVFDKIKSMMTGAISGNKVVFQRVPEGESAKVISVGIKNGKPISAMETVQLSRTILSGLKFEPTTPSEFKEGVGTMDK